VTGAQEKEALQAQDDLAKTYFLLFEKS